MAKTHNQLLIDMLMRLSGEVAKVDGIGGTRDWLIAELSTVIAHAQDGPHERVLTQSEVRAILRDAGLLDQIGHSVDKGIYSQRRVNAVFRAAGIFLDPA